VNNIPGVDGIASMAYDTPVYVDPEQSIDAGLKWMPNPPTGRKRRKLIRRVSSLFQQIEKNSAANSLNVVRKSLGEGSLEHYGIPKIAGHADNLSPLQKRIVLKSAEDLMEYEFFSRTT
jgi:hypothetical protein